MGRSVSCFFLDLGYVPCEYRADGMPDRAHLIPQQRLKAAVGAEPMVIPGGPSICQRIGVVTGGAGSDLKRAAVEGVDTFITGEGPHWTYALAEELGINVLYGGHYATETFGVKALAARLGDEFSLDWEFLDVENPV